MKFNEALELLKAGKSVRLKSWSMGKAILLSDKGEFLNHRDYQRPQQLTLSDVESDDWEQYLEVHSFCQAMRMVSEGQRVRRLAWENTILRNDDSVQMNSSTSFVVNSGDFFTMDKEDVDGMDWVKVEHNEKD